MRIDWANIQAGPEHNFYQHITDGDDIGAYDFGSIMHYPRNAFCANGQDTIIPTRRQRTIGQRTALSAGDIAAANSFCPKPKPIKENTKDIRKDPLKEIPRDTRKELIKDIRTDTRKELVRDTLKEQIKDVIKDRKVPIRDRRKSPFENPVPQPRLPIPRKPGQPGGDLPVCSRRSAPGPCCRNGVCERSRRPQSRRSTRSSKRLPRSSQQVARAAQSCRRSTTS